MAGLFHTMSVASQALFSNRQGLDTTAHNIANAQSEGYSRQEVRLTQRAPSLKHGVIIGNGVYVGSVARSHDQFLEQQVVAAGSSLGESKVRNNEMKKIESIYSPELRSTIANEMSSFFDRLQSLSAFPDELSARTSVREQANTLAAAFRRIDFDLGRARDNINENIRVTLQNVNDLLHGIGRLNLEINQAETGNANSQANDLRDQRNVLVNELGSKININYYDDGSGMLTIRGPGETLLVDKGRASSISVRKNEENTGMFNVVVTDAEEGRSRDVTKHIKSGEISGLLSVRDGVAKSLIEQNDKLAFRFANDINEVHRFGYGIEDFKEQKGRDFFAGVEQEVGAARNIKLTAAILGSTDAIGAASSPSAPGDNVNLNAMLRLASVRSMENQTATYHEYYTNLVGNLGIEALRADHVLDADRVIHSDLSSRREAISGVSLDEEAANMIRWQTAFTASSKVITAVDEMMEAIIGLKR